MSEYDDSDDPQRLFVYGNYIDEVLLMKDTDNTDSTPAGDSYYLHDHLYSPVALLDSTGTVQERYEYNAYGTVSILSTNYEPRTTSSYGNPYTFTGRRLDTLDNGNSKKCTTATAI